MFYLSRTTNTEHLVCCQHSGVHALAPAKGSESIGPGSGVNKTAREAVYATCMQVCLNTFGAVQRGFRGRRGVHFIAL